MDVSINPAPLSGSIAAIPSKSAAHRALICAALSDRETELFCPSLSRDIEATASCLASLGADIRYENGTFYVKPIEKVNENAALNCGESGSTLRFLLPVVCALGFGARLKMEGRLAERPLSPLWEELIAHGAELSKPENDIIAVSGKLSPGTYKIRADVSSQFISGLLFALPILGGESRIELEGNIESAGYIRMTSDMQKNFGLHIPFDGRCFDIPAESAYKAPGKLSVEGDWSNAAFWLVAGEISDGIEVAGLDENSAQGDRAVRDIIKLIRQGNATVDCKDVPDLVPVLSVLAALTPGETSFVNASRLRIKESDRLTAVCKMLHALGGDCTELEDGLVIHGRDKLTGGCVDGMNDHRIVMSAAVAAAACEKPVTILGAQAAEKSYPAFFEDYKKLGGIIS